MHSQSAPHAALHNASLLSVRHLLLKSNCTAERCRLLLMIVICIVLARPLENALRWISFTTSCRVTEARLARDLMKPSRSVRWWGQRRAKSVTVAGMFVWSRRRSEEMCAKPRLCESEEPVCVLSSAPNSCAVSLRRMTRAAERDLLTLLYITEYLRSGEAEAELRGTYGVHVLYRKRVAREVSQRLYTSCHRGLRLL
ncbi:hypothetical protein Tco_0556962 [Tanacetum coccineum]